MFGMKLYKCRCCSFFRSMTGSYNALSGAEVRCVFRAKELRQGMEVFRVDTDPSGDFCIPECPRCVVKVKKCHPNAVVPEYHTEFSSGFDLRCAEKVVIMAGQTKFVDSGVAMELPDRDMEIQIRARSGLSLRTPYLVKNSPATIDWDYRGTLGVIVHNLSTCNESITFEAGDRIAQGVICRVDKHRMVEVDVLSDTERGQNGFGSTGIQ